MDNSFMDAIAAGLLQHNRLLYILILCWVPILWVCLGSAALGGVPAPSFSGCHIWNKPAIVPYATALTYLNRQDYIYN